MKYRIFWDKEPNNHTFYLDIDKKRFYKKVNLNSFAEHFYQEKKFYETLADTDFIPKVYSITEKDNFGIIEMEFIESPPLWGYGRNCFSEISGRYTKEEIDLTHILVDQFLDLLLNRKLISGAEILFEFGVQNTIYDHKTKRLLFFDFQKAFNKTETVKYGFHKYLNGLSITDKTPSTEYLLKNFLYPDEIKKGSFGKIYTEGKLLYEDIIKADFNIYHSFYLDDKFMTGQRLLLDEDRLSLFNFSRGEFKNKTILDIGCNLGEISIFAVENGASKVIGIDLAEIINFTKRYVKHLSKIYCTSERVYDKIELHQVDIRKFEIPDVNICFYLSCHGHFGSPDLHSKLGKKVSDTIFVEGHAKTGEKERIKSILKQFGNQWIWKFLGYCEEGMDCLIKNRPLFRGDKKC